MALRGPPPDGGPLHGLVRPATVVLGHAETADGPPVGTEHLPEAHPLRVHRLTGFGFVAREEIRVVAEPPHRQVAAAKAPGVGADPAEITHGVANVGHFPVEDGDDPLPVDHEVAVAEIVVNQRKRGGVRQVVHQPAASVVDHRLRRRELAVALPSLLQELGRRDRVQRLIQAGGLQVDGVDAREYSSAFEGELRTHGFERR